LGRWQEAEQWYRQAASIDPANPLSLYGIGNALSYGQHWGEAEKFFRKAAELEPRNGRYLSSIAGCLARQGHTEEALALAQKGLALGFRDHWVYQELGLTP